MYKKFIFFIIFFLIHQNLYSEKIKKSPFENYTGYKFRIAQEKVLDYFWFKEANLLESSDENRALEIYKKIIDIYPDSLNYKKALRRIVEIKLKRQDVDLEYFFEKYFAKFSSDYDLVYKMAIYFLSSNQKEKAIKLLKFIFNSSDMYSVKALKKLLELDVFISDKDKLYVIKKLYDKQLFDEIVELDKINSFTGKEERNYLIRSLFKTKRYKVVAELTKDDSDKSLRELYLLSILRIGEKEKFLKEIEYFFENGDKNFFDLYLLYFDIKRIDEKYEEALKIINLLKEYFPEKKEIILWKESLLFIEMDDFLNAESRLKELLNNYQQNRYIYWLGKVNEYQGKDGSTYYNMLRNEEDYYFKKRRRIIINSEKNFYLNKNIDRVDALILLNMVDEAKEELIYHLIKNAYDEINLVDYFKKLQLYNYLIKVGVRLNDIFLKYPLAYYETIFQFSERFNIDPLLALAIMREESHFRKDAVSSAKAYGLMQVIFPTAKKFNKNISEKDLFVEEKNIEVGIKYLAYLVKKFKNIEEAVSAYNAGENNVEKWLNRRYKDIDEFIENIPFTETRNYVKKVMKSYYIYKSLYEK